MAKSVIRHTVVDANTGEVVSDDITVEGHDKMAEPQYVKLYVHQWLETMGGAPNTMTDVLVALIDLGMTFASDSQVIHATAYEKSIIAEKLGLNPRSVDNTIQKLVKMGALKRITRGTYAVNPSLLGRGSWSDGLRMRVTGDVGPDGISNSTEVISKAPAEED